MKSIPQIKFKIDAGHDIKVLDAFVNSVRFDKGRSLRWLIKEYPKLKQNGPWNKLNTGALKKRAKKFIPELYKKRYSEIKSGMDKNRRDWEKKEKKFYALVSKLFCERPWPKGKYIAYATVWGVYPRFLESKTFCVPFAHRIKGYQSVVIAHEMLHFMFYSYFLEKYPRYDTSNKLLWNVSEIFNIIVQHSPAWLNAFKTRSMDYPEHTKIIHSLGKKYHKKKNWDVDELIQDITKTVRASRLLLHI